MMMKIFLAICGFLGILGAGVMSLTICAFAFLAILAIHNKIMRK